METCWVVTSVDQDVWYQIVQVLTAPSLEFSMIALVQVGCV